jgi:hypothetical protein
MPLSVVLATLWGLLTLGLVLRVVWTRFMTYRSAGYVFTYPFLPYIAPTGRLVWPAAGDSPPSFSDHAFPFADPDARS